MNQVIRSMWMHMLKIKICNAKYEYQHLDARGDFVATQWSLNFFFLIMVKSHIKKI